ncbi:hypothetical protein RI129_000430 [Pyrocoelia pectoralis]|uniref:Glycoside hydrolase 35 catalytic domain-containing protein n=1 Tax=Pyrocoelia pectoralis TaxID=417401 RepID=A0AAN7ZVT1_9COLE
MTTLPTLYDYYTAGGITTGLSATQNYFTLNNKNISLYSGSLHYFRVPQEYWRDRLRKMKAAGLNAVDTYVPWNLHEPEIGNYDFGHGGSDMQEFLNLETFLRTAQEEDLLAIVRPGPYICSEWEFGGLPSWLLREKDFEVRTSKPSFMKHVTRYFNVLLPILAALQFTLGGPIIAFQVENEYGAVKLWPFYDTDKVYLEQLRQLNINNGIVELMLTSDNVVLHGDGGTLPKHFLMDSFYLKPYLLGCMWMKYNHILLFQPFVAFTSEYSTKDSLFSPILYLAHFSFHGIAFRVLDADLHSEIRSNKTGAYEVGLQFDNFN